MAEFPLVQEIVTEKTQQYVIDALETRFGKVPQDLVAKLRDVRKEKTLSQLHKYAIVCPDLKAFRERLLS
jgi:hypothetical protein